MKFANIIMKREGRCTIGDDIQLLAIENLYKYMGIDYKEVVRIPFNELATYDGEYAVLPISYPLYGYSHDTAITQYSDKIIPVFLGMAILTDELSEKEIEYLKKYEPIGCRDQFTMEVLRKYNIIAYLNGCMTATFPRRDTTKTYDNIYCVDIPDSFRSIIPKEILQHCIFRNHVYMSNECPNGTEEKAREIYNEYVNNAKLIITTRLHAALPCIAAGIPTVLVKDQLSYRFAIINKLMHIYSKNEYDVINWNPEPVNYEEFKKKILDLASKRVMDTYNKYKEMYEISEFYEGNTENTNYFEAITDAINYLKKNYNSDDYFEYSLWGVAQTAEMVYRHIKNTYPNAVLKAVIDRRNGIDFCGVMSTGKEWLIENKNNLCLVCVPAAMPEAREYFKKIEHKKYLLCWEDSLPR